MTQQRLKILVTSNLLQGHTCDTCSMNKENRDYVFKIMGNKKCHHPRYCNKYNTCPTWEKIEESLFGSGVGKIMLPIVRKVFPSMIASNIVSVQPMAAPSNQIFYIKPKYKKPRKKKTKMDEVDRLMDKWGSLVGGIEDENMKTQTVKILENQAKFMEKQDESDNSNK